MSCVFPKEQLALHVEGDLSEAAAQTVACHVARCEDCRQFLEQLRVRQSLLKSLRRETISPFECTSMRREVMSIIDDRRDAAGWFLKIERAIMLGFRQRSYALAAFALLGLVSVSALAQMRHVPPDSTPSVAAFEGRDTLLRPEGYRDWMLIGPSDGSHRSGADHDAANTTRTPTSNVYINPSGYREFATTGKFPEGTLLVWESASRETDTGNRPHRSSPVLLASVKDSTRFAGGWGFFDFSGIEGGVTSKAQPLLESSNCRRCHRQDAETDHVFTQFYPALRSAHPGAPLGVLRGAAGLPDRLASSPARGLPRLPLVAHV